MTVSNKMAYAALEQSTTGQRPIWGTNALGQWVSLLWSSPALAHTYTGQRGCWASPARGADEPPLCLHLDLEVLVTEVDPELSRAPQTVSSFKNGHVALSSFPHITTLQ